MSEEHIVQPKITFLDEEDRERVHGYTLEILTKTGVRVDSPQACDLVRQKLGDSVVDGERVRFPPEAVEWALQTAPSWVDIYDRRGELAFRLGEDRTRFGIGVTTLFYQDPMTDQLTPFTRRNLQDMVRLGSRLKNFDVISTVGIVQDVPTEICDEVATLEMAANTTKPLVLLVSDEHKFPAVLDLLEALHGDLAARPFVLPFFNPVTPLVFNQGTVDKMWDSIRRGLPVIFSNYSLAGMSTPITPAGTLALLMAEILGGLTLSQLMQEGAPMILGIEPAFFDMKTMVNFYDPQSMLVNLACIEMMRHYRLPHCGTSGSGTGWGGDLLASETYWMNHITTLLAHGGLAPFVGDTLGSKAFSATNVVYVHEIIEQALRLWQGFRLDEASVGLDEIEQAGPGGNFLMSPTTLKRFRQAYYTSPIFPRWSMEKWQKQGSPTVDQTLRSHTLALLADLPVPEDHDELIRKGEWLIKPGG